jgi:hypothetical protein
MFVYCLNIFISEHAAIIRDDPIRFENWMLDFLRAAASNRNLMICRLLVESYDTKITYSVTISSPLENIVYKTVSDELTYDTDYPQMISSPDDTVDEKITKLIDFFLQVSPVGLEGALYEAIRFWNSNVVSCLLATASKWNHLKDDVFKGYLDDNLNRIPLLWVAFLRLRDIIDKRKGYENEKIDDTINIVKILKQYGARADILSTFEICGCTPVEYLQRLTESLGYGREIYERFITALNTAPAPHPGIIICVSSSPQVQTSDIFESDEVDEVDI